MIMMLTWLETWAKIKVISMFIGLGILALMVLFFIIYVIVVVCRKGK